MKYHLQVLTLISVFLFLSHPTCGQSQKGPENLTFSAYMDSASVDLNNHNYADSLQRKYSKEFYNYYKQNPNSETGNLAVQKAFTMWGNIGAIEDYEEATKQLSYDSKNWRIAILAGHNVYYLAEKKSIEGYVEYVNQLKNKLTHPLSKSQALLYLARHYNKEGDTEKTVELAREIIDINASDFFIEQAIGFQHEAEKLGIGSVAPDFKAKTIQGQNISLSDQKGKIVILEFWATWCGPCKPEIPYLKSISAKYSKDKVQIIGVSLDTDRERLENFLKKEDMEWLQIQQVDKYDDQISKLYNVYVIPRSFIIGRDGKIVGKNMRGEELEQEITKLIQQ